MSEVFDHPDGFMVKTGDRFACGLIDINWAERMFTLKGISGHDNDEMDPHEVWIGLKNGPAENFERNAVVVFELDGHAFQLAHYNLRQFEEVCYGPVEKTHADDPQIN